MKSSSTTVEHDEKTLRVSAEVPNGRGWYEAVGLFGSVTDTDIMDEEYMRAALAEADKAIPTPTAFCVGCVIVSGGRILAAGYSRELAGNTHAEANALQKLAPGTPLEEAEVYTTMEPCSVRTSGLAPCADALVAARVKRCIIGVGEPADFVVCEGAERLKKAGIEVVWLKGLEAECLRIARKGHNAVEG